MIRPRTVVSLEQALSLPYATWRFAHLGWRVIRIEAPPHGDSSPGDPNRYIGTAVAGDDRHSYFLAQNVGKESLVLNLKCSEGREILHRLIAELNVDVFCCNTLPGRYGELGIDYETLRSVNPRIVWAGISAMGPEYPQTPGYDPAIQAMAGFMELTGDPDGPPMLCGVPVTDLKAGDEVYAGVLGALLELHESGVGKRIDVSMLQAAASWLITSLPLLNFPHDRSEVSRAGNQHRKFIPSDVFKTADGHIYMAIGNDLQWRRLVSRSKFLECATRERESNAGRHRDREKMFSDVAAVFARYSSREMAGELTAARIPWAPVNDIGQVAALDAVRGKLTNTTMPDGRTIRLQPLPVDLAGGPRELRFAPEYGEHTDAILAEIGFSDSEIQTLKSQAVVCSSGVR